MLRTCLAGLCLALAMPLCAQDYPLSVSDDRPKAVSFSAKPEKVITLATFATDMMAKLGLAPVAVSTYSGQRPLYLGEAASNGVDVGELNAPNLELMATLDPDLTVGMVRYNGPFEKQIGRMGKFLAYNPYTIDSSYRIVSQLGEVLGRTQEAGAINAEFKTLLAKMSANGNEPGPSYVFLWHFQDTMFAYADNLMPAELISELGGRNLIPKSADQNPENAFSVIDPEQLLALDPDVLLVFSSHGGAVKYSPLFDRLKAVKNQRAWQMGYQYSQAAGPIARELVLREAAHLLFPERHRAPDMPAAARAKALQFAK